ncbi:diguanylate cyclase [Dongia sp.]|uniref:diguanylate cyclase n=1 Tax=Dongia sp. TaxID=1977262 RepID=UPI0035B096DB
MDEPWHSLLVSSGVVALFIALWSHIPPLVDCSTPLRKCLFGVLFGFGAIVCMAIALESHSRGALLDLRNVLIVSSSFIGGPLAGITCGLLAAAYRLYIGGPDTTLALFLMVSAVVIGSVVHVRMRTREPQRKDALVLAVAFTVLGGALYAAFVEIRPTAEVLLHPTLFRFATCLLSALAMAKEVRRQGMARTNTIYSAIMAALPDCLNVKDENGKFIAANPATAKLMRAASSESLIGKSDYDFYPEATAAEFRAYETELVEARTPRTIEQYVVHKDGSTAWLSTLKVPVHDQRGKFQGLITHNRDISVRKRLEQELAISQERLQLTFSNMLAGVAMFDSSYKLLFSNDRYLELFPMTRDVRQPGARFRDIIRASLERGEKRVSSREELERIVELSEVPIREITQTQFDLSDGRWIEARINPTPGGYFAVYTDVTDQKKLEHELKSVNAQLEELAQSDGLTGLLNRRAMDQFLAEELGRCARGLGPTSILLIDVDKFKIYNDTYGHLAGDECLRQVAQCLKESVKRTTDRVARYGGEEFAAILSGTEQRDAEAIAEQLRHNLQQRAIEHQGNLPQVVTVSIGVATIAPGTASDMASIIKAADEALYQAKELGRNRVVCAQTISNDETKSGRRSA